jgi:hypothetical protein
MLDFLFIRPEICTSKSQLNITPASGLTMEEHARRSMSGAHSENTTTKSISYPLNALARRFRR